MTKNGNDIPVYTTRHKALILNKNVDLKDNFQITKYLTLDRMQGASKLPFIGVKNFLQTCYYSFTCHSQSSRNAAYKTIKVIIFIKNGTYIGVGTKVIQLRDFVVFP